MYRWEFIRIIFKLYSKSIDISECLYLWERCLVIDCGEPTNEGAVNILDNIINQKGKLSDDNFLSIYIIKCLQNLIRNIINY